MSELCKLCSMAPAEVTHLCPPTQVEPPRMVEFVTLTRRPDADLSLKVIELNTQLSLLKLELAKARGVVEAAKEWHEAQKWAAQNPRLMLTAKMSSERAAEIMKHYFSKQEALFAALAAMDGGAGFPMTTDRLLEPDAPGAKK
jgi:hypothetical protein